MKALVPFPYRKKKKPAAFESKELDLAKLCVLIKPKNANVFRFPLLEPFYRACQGVDETRNMQD